MTKINYLLFVKITFYLDWIKSKKLSEGMFTAIAEKHPRRTALYLILPVIVKTGHKHISLKADNNTISL